MQSRRCLKPTTPMTSTTPCRRLPTTDCDINQSLACILELQTAHRQCCSMLFDAESANLINTIDRLCRQMDILENLIEHITHDLPAVQQESETYTSKKSVSATCRPQMTAKDANSEQSTHLNDSQSQTSPPDFVHQGAIRYMDTNHADCSPKTQKSDVTTDQDTISTKCEQSGCNCLYKSTQSHFAPRYGRFTIQRSLSLPQPNMAAIGDALSAHDRSLWTSPISKTDEGERKIQARLSKSSGSNYSIGTMRNRFATGPRVSVRSNPFELEANTNGS